MYITRVKIQLTWGIKLTGKFLKSNTSYYKEFTLKRSYKMSRNSNPLKPPEEVKNMEVLDKSKFDKAITIPYIDIGTAAKVSDILPCLKKYILKIDNLKPVHNEGIETLILLNPIKVNQWADIQETDRDILNKYNINSDCLKTCIQKIGYENFSVEDIFRTVLPSDKEGVASYTKIGHIVHVNLREHLLQFKQLIGSVLFDKTPGCRTVVNKIDSIDNTYRNFKMEVLAGEEDFMVELKENKCRFQFDFSTVYWNSRLCTEHERIINLIAPGDVLFDIFAGVGPFSVPAAKKKAIVYANDLNPESYKWMQHNAKINKVGGTLMMYNKDGREFILNEVKENLIKHINKSNIHIVMNLPALATEFLDAFKNLFDPSEISEITKVPLIYVYCFAKGEDCNSIARSLVLKSLGDEFADNITDIFKVRTVSSMKEMMRVTIKLDRNILLGNKRKCVETDCSDKRCSYIVLN